jgi:predicted membrane protein
MDPHDYQHRYCRNREFGAAERMVPAIVLIGIGGLFLLNNLHIVQAREILRYWPAIVIAVGIVKLVDSADSRGRAGGAVIVGVGSIFMARSLGYLDIGIGDMWPLILIGIGIVMLFDRTNLFQIGEKVRSSSGAKEAAVFSGGKRTITDQNFTGAKYEAVFGGYEIDLRNADILGDTAEMELNAVFGGIDVKVPVSWSVVLKGTGVFGAFEDSTAQPDPRLFPNPKKLVVKGGAVFGGVEIKN